MSEREWSWVAAAYAGLGSLLVGLLASGAAPLVLGSEVLEGSKRLAIALLENWVLYGYHCFFV